MRTDALTTPAALRNATAKELNFYKVSRDFKAHSSRYLSSPIMAQTNPFLLAADDSPTLLPLLRSNLSLASAQDDHGYSLLHAAASYNHLSLLRTLVNEFNVDVNLRDEDGETCLFVTETVELAKCLVEELGADPTIKNSEALAAEETIEQDGSFPLLAAYLRDISSQGRGVPGANGGPSPASANNPGPDIHAPPPLPPNIKVNVGTVGEDALNGNGEVADPDFKRRIEELAARDNFHSPEGQQELRELITDAVRGVNAQPEQRDVRRRVD